MRLAVVRNPVVPDVRAVAAEEPAAAARVRVVRAAGSIGVRCVVAVSMVVGAGPRGRFTGLGRATVRPWVAGGDDGGRTWTARASCCRITIWSSCTSRTPRSQARVCRMAGAVCRSSCSVSSVAAVMMICRTPSMAGTSV